MQKILKKIMMKLGDSLVDEPVMQEITNLDVTGRSNYRLEGHGKGFNSSVLITGSTDVLTVENCVCTLRDFNGKLVAKNSQVYVDNALASLDLEHSSLDILGKLDGDVKAVFCYIKTDEFFSTFTGSVKASLGGAYIGFASKLETDGSVAIQALEENDADDAIFKLEKVRIADYRSLEALPHLTIDAGTVVRINNRYMLFSIKNDRVKMARGVYVNYGNGVALVDASGNVLYRKH